MNPPAALRRAVARYRSLATAGDGAIARHRRLHSARSLLRELRRWARRTARPRLAAQIALSLGLALPVAAQRIPQFGTAVEDAFGLAIDSTRGDEDLLFPRFIDIDGDGDLDMFSPTYDAPTVVFQENVGTPSQPQFGPRQTDPFGFAPPTAEGYYFPVGADFDGDGDVDLLVGAYTYDGYIDTTEVLLYENVGTAQSPSFGAGISLSVADGWTELPYSLTLTDIDGDGDLDLLGTNEGYLTEITLRENTAGPGSFPAFGPLQRNPFGLTRPSEIEYVVHAFGDLDGDGDVDILGFGYEENTYELTSLYYENIGTATQPNFGSAYVNSLDVKDQIPNTYYAFPSLADLDDDGDDDLFTLTYEAFDGFPGLDTGRYRLFYFENTGTVSDASAPAAVEAELLRVGPNPTGEYLDLYWAGDAPIERVEVYAQTGQRVIARAMTGTRVELRDLAAGVYELAAYTADGQRLERRFAKQ